MLGTNTLTFDIFCSCGCNGPWKQCPKKKLNRKTFDLSPPPSPCRTDKD